MDDIGWIREGLKRPGKTQRGLAQALGLDPAAVNRLLNGKRQLKASEVELVRFYFGEQGVPHTEHKPHANIVEELTNDGPNGPLRVLGMAEGGPDGWSLWNGDTIEFIERPANLKGVPGAYAVYITGDSMAPRYNPGELAHIHPHKPVTPGAYVLVQKKPKAPGEPPLAVIKRLVRRSGNRITLEQHNPVRSIDIRADEVVSMHRVVGSSEA